MSMYWMTVRSQSGGRWWCFNMRRGSGARIETTKHSGVAESIPFTRSRLRDQGSNPSTGLAADCNEE